MGAAGLAVRITVEERRLDRTSYAAQGIATVDARLLFFFGGSRRRVAGSLRRDASR